MRDIKEYDALIVVTPADYLRVEKQYGRLLDLLPVRNLIFIGNSQVGELVKSSELGSRARFLNEDDVVKFSDVHTAMKNAIGDIINGELPRGITGWYYQQFLKLSYSSSVRMNIIWYGMEILYQQRLFRCLRKAVIFRTLI